MRGGFKCAKTKQKRKILKFTVVFQMMKMM